MNGMTDTAHTIEYLSDKELRSLFDNNVVRLLDDEIILDKNRLGNLRMCVYLTALSLSAEEIAALKKSDYSFSDSTLNVKGEKYPLPDFISNDIRYFIGCDGYFSQRGNTKVFYNFILQKIPSLQFLKKKQVDPT